MRRTLALAILALLTVAAHAHAAGLRAGAGMADITPPTNYFYVGYAVNDRSVGVSTRLYARAIVLQQGARKVALVSADLVGMPGNVLAAAANFDKDIGFSQENVLAGGTHTHSGPGPMAQFGELNTYFPQGSQITDPQKFLDFKLSAPPDPQLYTFTAKQIAAAIRAANADLGPAAAGWSDQQLLGVTQNRSLEAHLANFGIVEARGQGKVSQDPGGYPDTIDPALPVLRIDKLKRKGKRTIHVPIGIWTTFANHGTDNEHTFPVYDGDHQATAERMVQDTIRAQAHVPGKQTVVNVFDDADEGDQSSGLIENGPAWANHVGQQEGAAMLRGWTAAGKHMTRSMPVDLRWTRICFCGQSTKGGGTVDTEAVVGLPVLTGSEEGRGPLYDATGVEFEGDHLPLDVGPQGDKIQAIPDPTHTDDPQAVPLMAVRVGNHLIVSIPGEATVEMGRQIRSAVLSALPSGSGISTVSIAGLANEYVPYYTTPAEYEQQHYEGGHTVYGEYSGYLIRDSLATLAAALGTGKPAPAPYPFDPTAGHPASGGPFDQGASKASVASQPGPATPFDLRAFATPSSIGGSKVAWKAPGGRPAAALAYICTQAEIAAQTIGSHVRATSSAPVIRFGRAGFSWHGGPRGFDMPVGKPFITVQRQAGTAWKTVTTDLGVQIVWTVDSSGLYRAAWQVPYDAPTGTYRFLITANRYQLASASFPVAASGALKLKQVPAAPGRVAVTLAYPALTLASRLDADLTWHPALASGGTVRFKVGARTVTVRQRAGTTFSLAAPPGTQVIAAQDSYGNTSAQGLTLR